MAYYMIQAAYTSEAWGAQTRNPQNVRDRLRPLIEGVGGRIESIFYSFGEYDLVAIIQAPDNVKMASGMIAALAGGAARAVKTTPLLTVEEGMEAMRGAAGSQYRPPSG